MIRNTLVICDLRGRASVRCVEYKEIKVRSRLHAAPKKPIEHTLQMPAFQGKRTLVSGTLHHPTAHI